VGKWDFEIRLRNSRPITAQPTLITEAGMWMKMGMGWNELGQAKSSSRYTEKKIIANR